MNTGSFYAATRVNEGNGKWRSVRMQRWLVQTGAVVDHINGNTLDNRRCNLRPATWSENAMNRKVQKYAASGFKGVTVRRKRFYAAIRVKGRLIHLGSFDTAEAANESYKQAALEHFGEFARA